MDERSAMMDLSFLLDFYKQHNSKGGKRSINQQRAARAPSLLANK